MASASSSEISIIVSCQWQGMRQSPPTTLLSKNQVFCQSGRILKRSITMTMQLIFAKGGNSILTLQIQIHGYTPYRGPPKSTMTQKLCCCFCDLAMSRACSGWWCRQHVYTRTRCQSTAAKPIGCLRNSSQCLPSSPISYEQWHEAPSSTKLNNSSQLFVC